MNISTKTRTSSRLTLLVPMLFLIAILATGCNPPPQHAVAFSPDGRSIAYSGKNYDSLILHNFDTGVFNTLRVSQPDATVTGVFWPEAAEPVFIVEHNFDRCLKREKSTTAAVIGINPANGEETSADKFSISCSGDELDLPLWTSFDQSAGILEITGRVFETPQGSPIAKAIAQYILAARKNSEITFNFTLSPDRRHTAFFAIEETGAVFPDSIVRGGFHIRTLEIESGETATIFSPPPGSLDVNRENEEFQFLAFFNTLKWGADGRNLYFLEPQAGSNFLAKYNIDTKRRETLLKQNVVLFDLSRIGDSVLSIVKSTGGWAAVLLDETGAKTGEFPLPKISPSSRSLKMSPDGRRAALMVPLNDKTMLPLLIDLEKRGAELLVAGGPDDYVLAGDFFAKQKLFAQAVPYYEKAGSAGAMQLYRIYNMTQDQAAGSQIYRQLLDSYKAEGKDPHFQLAEKLRAMPEMYETAKREYMLAEENNLGRALLRAATLAYKSKKQDWPELYRRSLTHYRQRSCQKSFRAGCPGQENVAWLLNLAARCTEQKLLGCDTEYAASLAQHLKPQLFAALSEKHPTRPAPGMFEMLFALAGMYDATGNCPVAIAEYRSMLSAIENLPAEKRRQYTGPASDAAGGLSRLESKCAKAKTSPPKKKSK